MIQLKINNQQIEVPSGSSIFDACKSLNIYVPTLCNHPDIPPSGNCGICVVKVNNSNFVLSCSTKAQNGMVVETNSFDVKRKGFEALCAFNEMARMPPTKEIEDIWNYFTQKKRPPRKRHAENTNSVSYDPNLCINCGRCTRMCRDVQNIGALDEDSHSLKDNDCIQCGQCITVCPTQALKANSTISGIIRALSSGKILILQIAPSVRVSIGESFGEPVGSIVTGKIIQSAREIGFRYVFDTDFGADLTIIEEGSELVSRLKHGGVFPMFTSCCPAWVNFVEKLHPELIPHLSTAKSPHMMTGAIIKTYFAERSHIDPKNIYVVSLMPCTAKKDEIRRDQLKGDVDCVITSTEFSDLVQQFEIDWSTIIDSKFDKMLGESSGSAALFGVSGGVAEAAVRFIHEELTSTKLDYVNYSNCIGSNQIKIANINIGNYELKIAVCNGISYAREFIESGEYLKYHFVEVMACPFGCIGGGGQPKLQNKAQAQARAEAIFRIDHNISTGPSANDNNEIKELFSKFLGRPNEGLSYNLLHTSFRRQDSPLIELKRKLGSLPIVAYGSSTGFSYRLAQIFSGYIGGYAMSLDSCTIPNILKKGTIIIICSTTGNGEIPSNALSFAKILRESKEDLSSLKYAICGIGSKDYPMFCYAGKILDKLFHQHGARRLLPYIEIDTSIYDQGEKIFETWSEETILTLGLQLPDFKILSNFKITKSINPDDSIINNPEKPIGFEYGVMITSSILSPQNIIPQMHRYQIKLPLGQNYETGDHVSILPQNDINIVNLILSEFKYDPNTILSIESILPGGNYLIPNRVTILQLFSQYIDLNCKPNRNLIRCFQQFSKDQFIKDKLNRLLTSNDSKHFEEFLKDINVGEFLLEYCRYGIPPLDLILSSCTLIRPRIYCIASSPSGNSKSIDLIINDTIFGEGNSRNGLCTSFLRRFGLTKIPLKIQKGVFNYPRDPTTPIIMTALGCGIAPMLSLLQHREYMKGEIGNAILFFGRKYKDSYPLLDSILQNYIEQGSLQDLKYSFSRENNNKSYITDLIKEDPNIIWEYWKNPKTPIIYCGPSRTIPDQLHELFVNITIEKGNMNKDQAEKFCKLHPHYLIWF